MICEPGHLSLATGILLPLNSAWICPLGCTYTGGSGGLSGHGDPRSEIQGLRS